MSKTVISTAQARELQDAGFSLGEIVEQYDIDLAGEANVSAAAAQPTVNEELHAAAKALYEAGIKKDRNGKALRTQEGRPKSVLGQRQGLGEFRVMVTAPKGYKG